jgi:hypothetical protein
LRRPILVVTFILASLLPLSAAAQGVQRLNQLNVSLWPEYDRRMVLVILQAELPADVPLPATVELPIPVEAGQPHAVAYQAEDGGLINADYQSRQEGPWTIISLQSESSTVWLEYYQALTTVENERSFTYIWAGSLAVDSLTFEVQEPVGSSGMQIAPEPTSTRTDSSGLTYQQGALGALESGQTATVDVRYTKADSALTIDSFPPPSASENQTSAQNQGPLAGLTTGTIVALAVGLVAVVVLIVSGIGLIRGRRPNRKPARRRRGSSPRPQKMAETGGRFCPQCGKPIQAGDKYCRHCGMRIPER